MNLSDKIKEVLDHYEISCTIESEGLAEIEFYSNYEEVSFSISYNSDEEFIHEFYNYYNNFDPDKYVIDLIREQDFESVSVRDLIDNAEEIEEFLSKVSRDLLRLI